MKCWEYVPVSLKKVTLGETMHLQLNVSVSLLAKVETWMDNTGRAQQEIPVLGRVQDSDLKAGRVPCAHFLRGFVLQYVLNS